MTSSLQRQLLITLVAILTSGCFLFEQESEESLGTLQIDALLLTDTCGPGVVSAGAYWTYEVEVQRSGSTLSWNGPGGTVTGTFSNDEDFCIQLTNQWVVRDADLWLEDPGCALNQIERLCGTMIFEEDDEDDSTTEEVVSLTARHESYVSYVSGTSCPELIGIGEGQYLTLPCQVAYELTGTPVD